jgi:hypothetical protein
MSHASLLLSCLLGLMAVFSDMAAAAEDTHLIRDLLKTSGFERQINQIQKEALTAFDKEAKRLATAKYQALRTLLKDAFNPSAITRQVFKRLQSELDPLITKESSDWLRTDLGKKILKLADSVASPGGLKDLPAFTSQLKENPAPSERLSLAREVDFATHSTEAHLDIVEATAFSVAAVVDATLPQDQRQGEDRLRLLIDRQRPKLRDDYQDLMLTNLLYTYRTLTDEELERYVEFLEGENGQEVYLLASQALKDALYAAVEQVSRALSDVQRSPGRRKVA